MSSGSLEWGRLNSSGVFHCIFQHLILFFVNYETFIPVFLKGRGSMAGWVMAGIGEGLLFLFPLVSHSLFPAVLSCYLLLFLLSFFFHSGVKCSFCTVVCSASGAVTAHTDASLAKEGDKIK